MNLTVTLTATPELLTVLEKFVAAFTAPTKKVTKALEQPIAPIAIPEKVEANVGTIEPVAPPTPKADKISIEELRALVSTKAKAGKKEAIKSLLVEFNAESVSTLDSKEYQNFKTQLEAI